MLEKNLLTKLKFFHFDLAAVCESGCVLFAQHVKVYLVIESQGVLGCVRVCVCVCVVCFLP